MVKSRPSKDRDVVVAVEMEPSTVNSNSKRGSLIRGVKKFIDVKLKKKSKGDPRTVGLLQHDIHMDDMNDMQQVDDDSDSELANLENEFHAAFASDARPADSWAINGAGAGASRLNRPNEYSTMILGTGDDRDDDADIAML